MTLFPEPVYYQEFIRLIRLGLDSGDVHMHAFTLLSNHFHLILSQVSPYAISDFMKSVCGAFAQFFNGRRHRSGHVFQGRYKAVPLRDAETILRVSWYVHQNPVRANLVNEPELWNYGSMREYADLVTSGISRTADILKFVGGKENYLRFMKDFDPSNPASVREYLDSKNSLLALPVVSY